MPSTSAAKPRARRWSRFVLVASTALVVAAATVVLLWGGCAQNLTRGREAPATYVGATACARCHRDATEQWQRSHHALAMQPASEKIVAGDFDNAQFRYGATTTSFARRGGRFVVRTDGPDGVLRDYDVQYTFGVAPLQQYLIALDGGRLQALGIAWDTRPRSAGGQRWFHLYPNQDIRAGDDLHWTGIRQNWNYMCAECHSTNVRKNYDAGTRRFATTFAEANVSCEACHGPASRHVATKGKAALVRFARANEVDRCARCHSRREQFSDDYVPGAPLGNTHRVSLLEDPLYYSDGQMRDEVFEYGSFVQSRMYAKNVVCSDCHQPHSGALRATGNQLCTRCHAPASYDAPSHHFHPAASRGASCVGCHMPTRSYMVVHERHDHSLRVPRPDLTVSLGVPNACGNCHRDRSPAWAAQMVTRWYGRTPRGQQRYAEAFAAAARDDSGATRLLVAVAEDGDQPAIARATALERLGPRLDASFNGAFDVIRRGLMDGSALVRRAAVTALARSDTSVRIRMLTPLLGDSVRAVRMEAAGALAGVAPVSLDEYLAGERFNADRPENRVNVALLFMNEGRDAEAERELRAALEIDSRFAPALVNLADLYRATRRDADAERVLVTAVRLDATNAAAHHALGLLLVRQKRLPEALGELARATHLAPEIAHYGNVYALALDAAGKRRDADVVLTRVLARHQFDRDALSLLVAHLLASGDTTRALAYSQRLAALEPANGQLRAFVDRLSAGRE